MTKANPFRTDELPYAGRVSRRDSLPSPAFLLPFGLGSSYGQQGDSQTFSPPPRDPGSAFPGAPTRVAPSNVFTVRMAHPPYAGPVNGRNMGAMSVGLMRGQATAPIDLSVYPQPDQRIGGFGTFSNAGRNGPYWTIEASRRLREPTFRTGGNEYDSIPFGMDPPFMADTQAPGPQLPMQPFGSNNGMLGSYDPSMMPEQQDPETRSIDLDGEDLEAFIAQIQLQFKRASEGRSSLVAEANKDEEGYNQKPYAPDELPFEGALSLRVPAARSRVDKAASELGATFDRDGSPVFGATPLTDSMATLAPHVESFIHQNITEADAVNQYRIGILRSFKVGTSFLAAEIISRPVSGMNRGFEEMFSNEGDMYENALVIRSVKMQDMYVLPVGITDLKDAGFVGERFQMPRWKFNDMIADGFYEEPRDSDGMPRAVSNGTVDDDYGMHTEHLRLRVDYGHTRDDDPAGVVDLIKGWVRFQRPSLVNQSGDRRSRLFYVVFPANDPTLILRLKENPYRYVDSAPYTPMPAGMGDGTIWGESWMSLLRSLQQNLDTLHMLHIEAQKRAYSRFYLTREGSRVAETLKFRRTAKKVAEGAMNPPQTVARFMPDEVIETEDPSGDIKDFSFTDINPGFMYDENRIIAYMNSATIDDMPTQGSVRTAFELRTAAGQTAAKLKSYIKIIAAKCLKPHIEMVKAMLWEYKMPESQISEYVKFMEYGDKSMPITMTDFFTGVSIDPAGTTTSADETVAISTTASLMQEVLPMIMQIPGIVTDVPAAAREIVKERVKALGFQQWNTLFGLTPPTDADIEKNMMYMMLVKQMNSPQQGGQDGGMMGGPAMGADGGAVQGAPDIMGAMGGQPNLGDQQGGAATGLAPEMAQQMGAPPGANAQ
jgi:hypothetical protein